MFPLTVYPLVLLFPPPFPGSIVSSPHDEQASNMVTPTKAKATVGQTFVRNSLLLFFILNITIVKCF